METEDQSMNIQLVNSLMQVIDSLSDEERQLLEERLSRKKSWESTKQRLTQLHNQIIARREGDASNLSTKDIVEQIHQMREERTQQIMDAGFYESQVR
jgi:DNA-directed RNA polymerase specialized sigma subunit